MNTIYLDTNIFFYLGDPTCPQHRECKDLMTLCRTRNILLTTSAETIQEIVHFAMSTKQTEKGLALASLTLEAVQTLLPIDGVSIARYLALVPKYPALTSRDILHVAVTLHQGIQTIVSYDRRMRDVREVEVLIPQAFIRKIRT